MTDSVLSDETSDFSLVSGGPLFQLLVRARLSGMSLEWLDRRILFAIAVAWFPLLILSFFGTNQAGTALLIPFHYDIEVHVRYLVALPALLTAELFVHGRLRSTMQQFIQRGIVAPADKLKFQSAVQTTLNLRNSVMLEFGLLLFVYTAGGWLWASQVALGQATWYGTPMIGSWRLTPAGYWYAFVSIPIFQFLLLRWYLRLFIWIVFLWRVSRLDLQLQPMHTDNAGGLGFLGQSSFAFGPVVFAQGSLLAGMIANRVLFVGQKLQDFKLEVFATVVVSVVMVLGPLLMFMPHLGRARWRGELEYGELVSHVTQAFRAEWIRLGVPQGKELLSRPDFSALVDLGTAYATVQGMRMVPFGTNVAIWLTVYVLAPLLPLTLTVLSLDELLVSFFHVLF